MIASLSISDKASIFITCKTGAEHSWKNVSPQHIVAHIFSGVLEMSFGGTSVTYVAGDTVLVPANQLTRSSKLPVDGEPFKCVTIILPQDQLHGFYLEHPVLEQWMDSTAYKGPIKPHLMLDSFFSSLLPYFEMRDELPYELAKLKVQEILTILYTVDKRVSSIMGTSEQPGRIDLKRYMEEHFMYNLPLEKFALLTGRSLTGFKNDFKTIFQQSPGKWLTLKRLELAYHKLSVEKRKPTEVYLSAGFENMSHFSFAFKKRFGHAPSEL